MAASDEYKKLAWKSYHEKLSNSEFAWDENSLSQEDIVGSVPCLIDMVWETNSKKKNGEAAGPSGVLSEIVKTAGKQELTWHWPSRSDYSGELLRELLRSWSENRWTLMIQFGFRPILTTTNAIFILR